MKETHRKSRFMSPAELYQLMLDKIDGKTITRAQIIEDVLAKLTVEDVQSTPHHPIGSGKKSIMLNLKNKTWDSLKTMSKSSGRPMSHVIEACFIKYFCDEYVVKKDFITVNTILSGFSTEQLQAELEKRKPT